VLTSLLTLYAMAKVWNRAFWRGGPEPDDQGRVAQGSRMPTGMVLTAGFIVAFGIGLTVIAGPLYGYTQRAATDLLSQGAYVSAVLSPEVGR
jgi:multicomponent Na+:H+ antiporter subunit D